MSPSAVLTKLAAMLRNVPAVQFVFAKFAALLRNNESGEASGVIRSTVDQHATVLQPSSDHAIAVPEANDQSEREKLIRRRWTETGIKMWNPDVHGAGHAALNIQGRTELLPPKSGGTLPGYDTLEFKMVRSCVNGQTANLIVCESVVDRVGSEFADGFAELESRSGLPVAYPLPLRISDERRPAEVASYFGRAATFLKAQ